MDYKDVIKTRLNKFSRVFPVRARSMAVPVAAVPMLDYDESRIGFIINCTTAANGVILGFQTTTGVIDMALSFVTVQTYQFDIEKHFGLVVLPTTVRFLGGATTISVFELLFRG